MGSMWPGCGLVEKPFLDGDHTTAKYNASTLLLLERKNSFKFVLIFSPTYLKANIKADVCMWGKGSV